MDLNELSPADVAADLRLLVDAESVDHVTYSAEMHEGDRARVVLAVGVDGESQTRRFEVWASEVRA